MTTQTQQTFKNCAICKFAKHDPGLTDTSMVVCTLNTCDPTMKDVNDVCLSYEAKYANLKILSTPASYHEYDSENKSVTQIGEDQWQEK